MWTVANPGAPTINAKKCVKVIAKYTGSLKKDGSTGTTPTDIDIKYDTQKIGAGWNLYKAGSLTATASKVIDSANYFKATSEYSFSFPQVTVDFGAFLEAEPEAGAAIIGTSVSLGVLLAITFASHF